MKVRYTRGALAQLDEIHSYITQFNPRAAVQVITRIEELPKARRVPRYGTSNRASESSCATVVRYPYLIFYTIIPADDEVRILRVRHGRRRPLTAGEI